MVSSFWIVPGGLTNDLGLSNGMDFGGLLGSIVDFELSLLNLKTISPKECVGCSIPSGAASASRTGWFWFDWNGGCL